MYIFSLYDFQDVFDIIFLLHTQNELIFRQQFAKLSFHIRRDWECIHISEISRVH